MNLPDINELFYIGRVSVVDKMSFTRHLAIMLRSGIPLPESIEIITAQNSNLKFRKVLKHIFHDISNGQLFSKALMKFPKIFDSFYVQLVKVGEESGELEKNLDYLALYLKKNYEFNNKIKSAMLYPMIVLGIAFVSAGGLSIFVMPRLVDLFNSLDVQLPLSTRILLGISQIMKDYSYLIFTGIFILFLLLKLIISSKAVKPNWHYFLLSLPLIGEYFQNIELSAFYRNMGIMIKGGIPLLQSFDTQKNSTKNLIYQRYLRQIIKGVEEGKPLEYVFTVNRFKFYPLIATRMISVGEKTGKLGETFSYLGDYFEDEVDNTSKNFSTILEPIILIIVGLIVAFIAISIIGPIYQFTGSIKR